MKNIFKLALIAFMLFLTSCLKDNYNDDTFVLKRNDFGGQQLRLDGYYVSENTKQKYVCKFFQNGSVLFPSLSINEIRVSEVFENDLNRSTKVFWGIFAIDRNSIKIEYYKNRMFDELPAYIASGEILNDTSFVLKEVKRSRDGSDLKLLNEVYRFKKNEKN